MSHLYESDDESAGETCYNPVAKFFHLFPNGFFKPTVQTMTRLYKSAVSHVELLFDEIQKITNVDDRIVRAELQKRGYQVSKFKKIKNYVQFIFDRFARLHVYANEIDVSDYFELFGQFLKRLLERWDQFFCAVFRIRFKIRNNSGLKQLKRYHKIAEFETRNIYRKISQLRLRIDSALPSCDISQEDKVKENFFDSLLIFRLDSYKFEARCLDDSESEDEDVNMKNLGERRNSIPVKRKRNGDEIELDSGATSAKRRRKSISTAARESSSKEKNECFDHFANAAIDSPLSKRSQFDGLLGNGQRAISIHEQRVCLKLKLKREGENWVSSLSQSSDKSI